jgi:hypothetical protein
MARFQWLKLLLENFEHFTKFSLFSLCVFPFVLLNFLFSLTISFYSQIGRNTLQLATPIWKLEIAGREAKKFAEYPLGLLWG